MIETLLLTSAWIIFTVALIIFVPRNRIREAWVIYLFKQIITWLLGLAVVELRLIEYPIRLFAYANKTSFSFEYFIYPAICVIFNLHYPVGKSSIKQLLYYIVYCSAITIIEVFCEKYTDIINYTGWTWYYTWLSLFATFYLTRMFYLWFFKTKNKG